MSTPISKKNVEKLSRFVLGVLQLYRPGMNVLVQSLVGTQNGTLDEEVQEAVSLMKVAKKLSPMQIRERMEELRVLDEVIDEEGRAHTANSGKNFKTMSDLQ